MDVSWIKQLQVASVGGDTSVEAKVLVAALMDKRGKSTCKDHAMGKNLTCSISELDYRTIQETSVKILHEDTLEKESACMLWS